MKSKFIIVAFILFLSSGLSQSIFGNFQEPDKFSNLVDIPRLEVDIPKEPRIWEIDVSVLRDSIAAQNGKAMIGFKAPESDRMMHKSGIRTALSAEQFKEALEMIESKGVEILYIYRTFGAASVKMDPDIVYDLHDHPMIDYIEIPLPFKIQLACFTNDSYVRSSTQITPWGVDMVKAPQAWNVTKGSGAKVYVIDTGMEDHVDLPDRPSENCGGLFDGCSDGPTYHGTHVSGTLMALDNDIGVVGVSPALNDNDVYSWAACCPSTGSCYSNNIAAGIDAAILDEVDVINMSFGGPSQHTGVANAVAVAWNNGIVMVAAAGNLPESEQGGDPVYPAGYTQVIGVSGLKSDGSFANTSPCIIPSYNEALKSNHGPHVEISAPFWALSTVGTNQYEDENDGWCGTSMAAPHVAGTVALMKSINPELSPS